MERKLTSSEDLEVQQRTDDWTIGQRSIAETPQVSIKLDQTYTFSTIRFVEESKSRHNFDN